MTKLLIVVGLLLISTPSLNAQSSYYKGKSIRIIVGYLPGDNHDLWARGYARYMGKYIPGNPDFIVQNMPGAGSMIAANYVYNLTKPDGLTLGSIGGALYYAQVTGREEVKFNWAKFTWIGTADRNGSLVFIRSDAPYKTLEDIRNANEPPKCSATGVGSAGYDIPRLLTDTLGLKFNVISGYPGGAEQDLALERGEVHCRAITVDGFFGREPFLTWYKTGFVRILLQTGRQRNPRIPDVPTLYELMDQYKVPEARKRLATVYLGAGGFGSRPIVSTPGLPRERVQILREAYAKALKDSEFVEEARKKKWPEIQFSSGADLEALAKEVTDQPPEVVEWLKKLLGK
jgi:tripartite-type tricarboxylate transporter receptor subunit TctC